MIGVVAAELIGTYQPPRHLLGESLRGCTP
jgi:hypothetical protein